MKICIPNSAFLGNIDFFLKGMDLTKPDILELSFHQKWMSLHPIVLSMLAAIAHGLPAKAIHFDTLEAKSRHYLERMRLFAFLQAKSGINMNEHEPTGRFIPLTQIKTSNELSDFIKEITPLLHLGPHKAEPIRYIMSELIRNVIEHANTESGAFVCAQYFEKSNKISIGIADTGVGILKSINQSYSATNDLEAIQLALTPGITGTTRREGGTELNAGAGLFFVKSIASVNKDFFVVYSGNAMYKLLKKKGVRIKLYSDPFEDKHSKADTYPKWQGTAIGIDLSLNDSDEFATMLTLFRETWHKAIKARKKAKFKKAKFI